MLTDDQTKMLIMAMIIVVIIVVISRLGKIWLRANSQPTIVLFYADWCPASIATKPEFDAAVSNVDGINVEVVESSNTERLQDYERVFKSNITAWPTIWMIDPAGDMHVYIGPRDRESMQNIFKGAAIGK